jgi:hypothetical protein
VDPDHNRRGLRGGVAQVEVKLERSISHSRIFDITIDAQPNLSGGGQWRLGIRRAGQNAQKDNERQ